MVLADYYEKSEETVSFDRHLASRFAKEIANDFNPLHDPGAAIFCVPGDLLFSVALERLGLSQRMCFTFSGMVSDEAVIFPVTGAPKIDIVDTGGKPCLSIERSGEITRNTQLIEHLVKDYVAFSGKTFPHILVPLMSEQGMMINPARPLVIYQRMEIELDRLDLSHPQLEAAGSKLEVAGRKGTVRLDFRISENGGAVGHGTKYMSLRGLQPFDGDAMSQLIDEYNGYRENYRSMSE